MKGRVTHANLNRSMLALMTPQGYTIVEVLGDYDIEAGDEFVWSPDTVLGHEAIRNLRTGEDIDVSIENHHVPEEGLRQALLF